MRERVLAVGLIFGAGMSPAAASCPVPLADVDASGETTVSDVMCTLLVTLWTLGGEADAYPTCVGPDASADVDCSGAVTVVDATLAIQAVLELPLSVSLDADSDGCPDACALPSSACQAGVSAFELVPQAPDPLGGWTFVYDSPFQDEPVWQLFGDWLVYSNASFTSYVSETPGGSETSNRGAAATPTFEVQPGATLRFEVWLQLGQGPDEILQDKVDIRVLHDSACKSGWPSWACAQESTTPNPDDFYSGIRATRVFTKSDVPLSGKWHAFEIPLGAWAGEVVSLRFEFDSVNDFSNAYPGPAFRGVSVRSAACPGLHTTCTPLNGDFDCGCEADFEPAEPPGIGCVPSTTCADAPCADIAACSDSPHGVSCFCPAGYSGDGYACADIDECASENPPCHPLQDCTNFEGSWSCAWPLQNECALGIAGCDAETESCEDWVEGFECVCAPGFKLSGNGNCTDINECFPTSNSPCAPDATCQNLFGGVECTCNAGFSGDGFECTDIDECASEPCFPGGTCRNTTGSYTCRCPPGTTGDGVDTCVDFNPCTEAPGIAFDFYAASALDEWVLDSSGGLSEWAWRVCDGALAFRDSNCKDDYPEENLTGLITTPSLVVPAHDPVARLRISHQSSGEITLIPPTGTPVTLWAAPDNEAKSESLALDLGPWSGETVELSFSDGLGFEVQSLSLGAACHSNSTCVDGDSNYECPCDVGFVGDGKPIWAPGPMDTPDFEPPWAGCRRAPATPGDLIATEIHLAPVGGATETLAAPQWIEVYNPTDETLDVRGLTVNVGGASATVPVHSGDGALAPPSPVPAHGYGLFASTAEPGPGEGCLPTYPPHLVWLESAWPTTGPLALTDAWGGPLDTVSLGADGSTGWPPLAPGTAWTLTSPALFEGDNDSPDSWCLASSTWSISDACPDAGSPLKHGLCALEPVGTGCTGPLITEYVYHHYFDRAVEISNPSSGPIDLAEFTISWGAWGAVPLEGFLSAGESVVICKSSPNDAFEGYCDSEDFAAGGIGTGAIVLRNAAGGVVDTLGDSTTAMPSGGWTVAGVEGATSQGYALRRLSPNASPTWDESAQADWSVGSSSDWSNLGEFTSAECD